VTAATTHRRRLKGGRVLRDGHVIYWWAEILAILGFYFVYSAIRDVSGSHRIRALDDARHVISIERHLHIFHEPTIQRWALHFTPLIVTANYMYGSLHFIVTIGVAVWLFRSFPDDYPRYRNTLAIATALALVGFTVFPLMPPRLLATNGLHLGFVDTLERYKTIWSFDSGPAAKVSNQYAAMPSVHIAWSTWCALAMVPRLKSRAGKILAALYPVATLIVIVITANHYLIDAAGGLVILSIGWVVAGQFTRAGRAPALPVTTNAET
jgi:hypothetical protein